MTTSLIAIVLVVASTTDELRRGLLQRALLPCVSLCVPTDVYASVPLHEEPLGLNPACLDYTRRASVPVGTQLTPLVQVVL